MRPPRPPQPDADRHGPPPRIAPSFEHADAPHLAAGDGRRIGPRVAAAAARAGKVPRRRWAAIAVLVALLGLLLALRQPLSDWLWPQNRAQQLRADAALALAQGRLTAADGNGARELYEAALALDPDRADARAGLARVGEAALGQARRALAERRYVDAHRGVALARELAVPPSRVDAVAAALRHSEAANAGTGKLLLQAAAARAAGRLDGDADSARPLFERVLALQPTHTQALEGREDTLADLLQRARQALLEGDLAASASIVHRVLAADPGHGELPGTLAALGEAADVRRRRADADLRRERLGSALDGYRAVLVVHPDDAAAERGLDRVAAAFAARSGRLAADFRFEEAEAALREGSAIRPDAPAITEARQRLSRARQAQARYASRLSPAERHRRLRQWLRQAADAEARGDLLTPPGDSAFDKLRAARAIAPQDPRVLKASARLLPAAKACFEKELRGNRLGRAGECLDARAVLEGDSAPLAGSRRRLAQRWIAVGNERLGADELQAAQAALAAARALDPAATGLDEFSERLRAATAAD